MLAFVTGLGSMGTRRVRDLRALGVEVEGFDPKDHQWGPADSEKWKAAEVHLICTPPDSHGSYALEIQELGRPYFIEAGVTNILDISVTTGPVRGDLAHPSCTPRFVPAIVRIQERVQRGDIGTPVAYTLHVGQHLADWHPGADLSSYYAAKRETGACRELVPFELGWLTWVFGPVTKAKALRGSLAGIAPIDDVYQVVVEHDFTQFGLDRAPLALAGVERVSASRAGTQEQTRLQDTPAPASPKVLGHLLIDAVSRPPRRHINIVGTLGVIDADIHFTEATYLAEMRAFVKSVEEGAPWPYSLAEERANLAVLETIERFS